MSAFAQVTSIPAYDGYISHRGLKIKKKFANVLYHALWEHGIHVFLDGPEFENNATGEDVREFMMEALRISKFIILIFTVDYGTSDWCLIELAEAVKRKQNNEVEVIPIYYNVKPIDLRSKEGKFARQLEGYLNENEFDAEEVKGWKRALKDVSWWGGHQLENYNGCEGDLIYKVVRRIQKWIAGEMRVVPCAVGLGGKVKEVGQLMHLHDGKRFSNPEFHTKARQIVKASGGSFCALKVLLEHLRSVQGDEHREKALVMLRDADFSEISNTWEIGDDALNDSEELGGKVKEVGQLMHLHDGKRFSNPEFHTKARQIMKASGGSFSALKVLSEHLRSVQGNEHREKALVMLRDADFSEMSNTWEIGDDALNDSEEEMSQDVTCFSAGELDLKVMCYREDSTRRCKTRSTERIQRVVAEKRLSMDDLWKDFGRKMGRLHKTRVCDDDDYLH